MPLSGAFLGGDGAERRPALLDFLAPAVRAEDLPFLVVDKSKDLGEELLAIVADKFVAGHTHLRGEAVAGEILEPERAEHNMVLAFSYSTGRRWPPVLSGETEHYAFRLPFLEPSLRRCGVVRIGVESNSPEQFSQEVALMETLNAPDTARGEMTRIGKSVAIKGEVSCGEDLYIDGQVEGTIDPKGNRLIIGPNGSVKANINARAVIVQGKLEGTIHASDRVDLKQSAIVVGNITTQRISIEEGAHLRGSVNLQKEAPQ